MLDDQSELRYYGVTFSDRPVYLNVAAFLPEWDFEGKRLQDFGYIAPYHLICFSAWVAGDRATAVFCWHKSADDVCVPFVESLRRVDEDRLASRLLAMAMEVSENVVFRMDWWESILESDRQSLVRRAYNGFPGSDRSSDSLMDDSLTAITSSIFAEHVGY